MTNNRLHIAYTDNKHNTPPIFSNDRNQKEEIQATMERLWLKNPQQFNPFRDCMERNRINTTFELIQSSISLDDKKVVDLGCGAGVLSKKMRDAGANVDAVDVSNQALHKLRSEDAHNITSIQDCLPSTALKDQHYDLVVCTELIAYLKSNNYRLFMAELARLVKSEGLVVCSTTLDINTNNPLDRFVALAETEFTVKRWVLSYHLLQLRLCHFFETPAYYTKCCNDNEFCRQELDKRKGFSRQWLLWNSHKPLNFLWKTLKCLFNPIASFFRQNVWMMKVLEKITKFFWVEAGISHGLFIGKRRPLTFPLKQEDMPRELKHKRQVWE